MIEQDENYKIIDGQEYISMLEASKACEYSQQYLSLLVRRGKLFGRKIGRNWYTTREALQNYLQEQTFTISLPKNFFARGSGAPVFKPEMLRKPTLTSSPAISAQPPIDNSSVLHSKTYEEFLKLNKQPAVEKQEEKTITAPTQETASIQTATPTPPPATTLDSTPLTNSGQASSPQAIFNDTKLTDAVNQMEKKVRGQIEQEHAAVVKKIDKLSESLNILSEKVTENANRPTATLPTLKPVPIPAPIVIAPVDPKVTRALEDLQQNVQGQAKQEQAITQKIDKLSEWLSALAEKIKVPIKSVPVTPPVINLESRRAIDQLHQTVKSHIETQKDIQEKQKQLEQTVQGKIEEKHAAVTEQIGKLSQSVNTLSSKVAESSNRPITVLAPPVPTPIILPPVSPLKPEQEEFIKVESKSFGYRLRRFNLQAKQSVNGFWKGLIVLIIISVMVLPAMADMTLAPFDHAIAWITTKIEKVNRAIAILDNPAFTVGTTESLSTTSPSPADSGSSASQPTINYITKVYNVNSAPSSNTKNPNVTVSKPLTNDQIDKLRSQLQGEAQLQLAPLQSSLALLEANVSNIQSGTGRIFQAPLPKNIDSVQYPNEVSFTKATFTGPVTGTGNLTIGTNALFVNADDKRVGIGTRNLTSGLSVAGGASISGAFSASSLSIAGGSGSSLLDVGPLHVTATSVGIGTASPTTLFEIQGTASASYGLFGTLQVGGFSSASYNRFGTATTGHPNYISGSNDLLISGDTETRGTASFAGVASVSGNFFTYGTNTFSGATTQTGLFSFVDASGSGSFELGGSASKLAVNAGGRTDTMFEVGGTASISGNLTFGGNETLTGTFTGNSTGSNSFSGSLDISKGFRALDLTGTNSVNTPLLRAYGSTLTINAFTLGGVVSGNSNNITGLNQLTAIIASVSNNFELTNNASIGGNIVLKGNITDSGTGSSSFTGSLDVTKGIRGSNFVQTGLSNNYFASNLGIGTNAPLTRFEVEGTASASNLLTVGTLQVGWGGATVSYSRFGSGTTAHSNFISTNNDLLVSGDFEVVGTAQFNGNVALGTTNTNLLIVNSTVQSNLIPFTNAFNLGSTTNRWGKIYTDSLDVTNLTAASSSISGTVAADFTINSDNVSADAEDESITFKRGSPTVNAALKWDSANKRFNFNFPVFIQTVDLPEAAYNYTKLTLKGVTTTQLANDYFEIQNNNGARLFIVETGGSVVASGAAQFGGNSTATASYSRFGTTTTTHSNYISAANDLLVSGDLAVIGTASFAGMASISNTVFVDSTNRVVGIGTTAPNSSALLDLTSTTKGFLGPRLTTTQRDAISSPVAGLLIYNSSTNLYNVYTGSAWLPVGSLRTEEGGVLVQATSLNLDFDPGAFALTASGTTETIVKLDYANGPASRSAAQTISGLWTFTGGASFSAPFELSSTASISGAVTLKGLLSWNSTGTTGLRLNNLTTVQRDLLSPLAGATIFNTTDTKMQVYNGTSWKNVGNPEIGAEVTSGTAGSVLFVDSSGNLGQNNSNFYWDVTNARLGIGTNAPSTKFEVQGTSSASYGLFGTLQVGGFASAAYSRFGTSTTGHSNYISTTNDVLVSGDFEVRGTASFGGNASISGTFTELNTGSSSFAGSLDITKGIRAVQANFNSIFVTTSGGGLTFNGGGTNIISSTGTLQLNAFTLGGTLTANSNNISGINQLGFTNASGSGSFELTSASSLLGINAGAKTDTMFEVGGTASVSGTLTLAGIITSSNTGSNSFSGGLEITKGVHSAALSTTGNALIGNQLTVSGNQILTGTFTGNSTGSSSFAGSLSVAKGFLAGANNALVVNATATANTLNVIGGNVGVGTTAPLAPLHVAGQCVTGDTKLRRRRKRKKADGNEEEIWEEVPIKNIKAGDKILTLDENTGKLVTNKVKGLMDMGVKPIYKLTTASGKSIRTTGNHPYLVANATKLLRTSVFIDGANFEKSVSRVNGWADYQKMKQSFPGDIRFYQVNFGTEKQGGFFTKLKHYGFKLITKPIKLIKQKGAEDDKKANFDVEIAVDAVDRKDTFDVAILFSGDSDFVYLVNYLQKAGKKVVVISPWKRTARELRLGADVYLSFNKMPFISAKNNQKRPRRADHDGLSPALPILSQVHPYVNGGVWTKVSEIHDGDMIATTGINGKPVFERVVSIERLPAEQVYDIEVEGTHNFIGNDIVAHNTFLATTSGNVGIGTTSPLTKFNVKGTASTSYGILTNALNAALGNAATVAYSRFGTSTTGHSNYISASNDLLVSGDFETRGTASFGGNASISGTFTSVNTASNSFAGSLAITKGLTAAAITGTNLTINTGNIVGNGTGSSSFSGSLDVSKGLRSLDLTGTNSINTPLLRASGSTLTINAFTLGGTLTGNSQNITGLNQLTAAIASVSNNFELTNNASIGGNIVLKGNLTDSGTGSSSFAGSLSVAKGFLAGANNALVVNATATANTLNVIGGNVGVGTTAPLAPLHVAGQCVTGDTKLRRRRKRKKADGNEEEIWEEVPIKNIKAGDKILTLDENTGKLVTNKVKGLMDMGVKPIYKLTTASGKSIRTTGNHPYLARVGFNQKALVQDQDSLTRWAVDLHHTRINEPSRYQLPVQLLDFTHQSHRDLNYSLETNKNNPGIASGAVFSPFASMVPVTDTYYSKYTPTHEDVKKTDINTRLSNEFNSRDDLNQPTESIYKSADWVKAAYPSIRTTGNHPYLVLSYANQKALENQSSLGVDPTGLAPASLRVKGSILLHKLQARIHQYYYKTIKAPFTELLLLTRSFSSQFGANYRALSISNPLLMSNESVDNQKLSYKSADWVKAAYPSIRTTGNHPYLARLSFRDSDLGLTDESQLAGKISVFGEQNKISNYRNNIFFRHAAYQNDNNSHAFGNIETENVAETTIKSKKNEAILQSKIKNRVVIGAGQSGLFDRGYLKPFLAQSQNNVSRDAFVSEKLVHDSELGDVVYLKDFFFAQNASRIAESRFGIADGDVGVLPGDFIERVTTLQKLEDVGNGNSRAFDARFSKPDLLFDNNAGGNGFVGGVGIFEHGHMDGKINYFVTNDYITDGTKMSNNQIPAFVEQDWVKAAYLSVGDEIAVATNDKEAVFEAIIEIKRLTPEQVYDIEVEGTHNFIGNDIVAHNTFLATTSGNVGIGTTSPLTKFNVKGTASTSYGILTNALNAALGNAATVAYSRFGTSTTGHSNYISASNDLLVSGDLEGRGSISFAGPASFSNAFFASGGNVGIGTTSPTARLHIAAGTATASTAPLKFNSGTLLTTTEAGAVEFNTDDYYATITSGAGSSYASDYPPAQSDTYVKATSVFNTSYPYNATDPAKSLTGDSGIGNDWQANSVTTNQRFHIDLGSAKTITRIYYENYHHGGTLTNRGVQSFTLWGSNTASAFADTTYATDTNWTQITTSQLTFDQHTASNVADPKYITLTNSTAYRYYAFKFANNYGDGTLMGVRRIELQEGNTARKGFVMTNGSNLVSGRIPYASTNGRLIDTTNFVFDGTNVGIGTSSPVATLDITGTASISSNFGVGNKKFYVNATSGNVGIGTAVPLTKFEVEGTASASNLLTVGTLQVGNAGATVSYSRFGTSATGHSNYISASNDLLVSGDFEVRGTVSFGGVASISGVTSLNGVRYTWPSADGSANQFLKTSGAGALSWATAGVASNSLDFDEFVDTMTLDSNLTILTPSSRKIGIGAAPSTYFEVQGTASASYLLTGNTLQVGGYSSAAYSRFGTAATTHAGSITTTNDLLISGDLEIDSNLYIDGTANFGGTASAALFYAQAGTAASPSFAFTNDQDTGMFRRAANALGLSTLGAERLTIISDGNVGINSTAPAAKLDIVQGTDALGMSLVANSNTTNNILNVTGNALTTGVGVNISSTGTGLTSGNLLNISSATTGTLTNAGGIVRLTATGNYVSTADGGVRAGLLNLFANSTTGGVIQEIQGNALTTGDALNILSTSTGLTSGALLYTSSATTGALTSSGIVSLNATGNYTSPASGGLHAGLLNVLANSTTAGFIQSIHGNALTTGIGLWITSTGTGLTSGSLLYSTSATTGAVSTGINYMDATGNYTTSGTGGLLSLVANSTTAGTIQLIQGNALTTGTALNISSSGVYTGTAGLLALTASGASTGKVAVLTANALSSGTLLDLSSTSTAAASNTQKLLNIALSGANATTTQTTYGGYISNTHTGTSSTNVGLYATASGGTNNYSAIFDAGNVGIGTTTPLTKFNVKGTASTSYEIITGALNAALGNVATVAYSRFGTSTTTHSNYISASNDLFISGDLEGRGSISFAGPASFSNAFFASGGNVGIGTTSPTARLHIAAGTATASTAPLKFNSGTLLTTTEAGAVEFNTDDYYATITSGAGSSYASDYPPAQSDTYVKATTKNSTSYWPYYATDPTLPNTGDANGWLSASGSVTNQRFNIDLGSTKTITRIYYDNWHDSNAGNITAGVQNFTLWGSNTAGAFADTTYATDTNWTQITTATSVFLQHSSANVEEPNYITLTNSTAYRYYSFKFADNWGNGSWLGLRGLELQEGSTARKGFVMNNGSNLVSGRIPYASTNGRLIDNANFVFDGTNVGIGSATPNNILTITGSADISGKLGIGTTAPSTKFEVQGTASASYLLTGNTLQVGGFASAAYSRFGTAATSYSNFISTTNDLLISGDLEVDATASFDGPLRVGSGTTPAFYVTGASGNVGIGTVNPVGKLTSNLSATVSFPTPGTGLGASAIHIRPSTTTAGDSSAITFGAVDTGSGNTAVAGIYVQSSGAYGTKMYLATTNVYGTGAQARVRIDNVGALSVYNQTTTEIPALGADGGMFKLLPTADQFGLISGVSVNGNVWMQAQRVDATATAYNFLLQPNGGSVGIGTSTVSAKLHSLATTEQLRLGYDASNYNSFTVGSAGSLTIAATGTNPNITLTPGGTGFTLLNGRVGIGTTSPKGNLFVVDSTIGSTSSGSFAIRSSNTIGTVASISATSLTSGNVLQLTVPASTSGGGAYFLVKDTAGVVYASLSNGGRFSIRRSMFSHGADVTNCTGTGAPSAGCVDYAENYPTRDTTLEAGEIVAVDTATSTYVMRASNSFSVIGIVSTNPGVLIGDNFVKTGDEANHASASGQIPVALAGRVPVKVTSENGSIKSGDRITLSATRPGYGMKMTESGQSIGVALEPFPRSDLSTDSRSDLVLVFVNLSYWAPIGTVTSSQLSVSNSSISNSAAGSSSIPSSITEGIRKTYFAITGMIGSIADDISNLIANWNTRTIAISTKADSATQALFTGPSAQAADQSKVNLNGDATSLETYGVDSTRGEIQMSGSSQIVNGEARIYFDYSFSSIISDKAPIRVIITPTSAWHDQFYVATKTQYGFVVKQSNAQESGTFDWLVIARRRGYDADIVTPQSGSATVGQAPTPISTPAPSTITPQPQTDSTPAPASETPTADSISSPKVTPSPSETPTPTPEPSVTPSPEPSPSETPAN